MRKNTLVALLSLVMLLLMQTAHAQSSGTNNVYRTKFFEMRGKVTSIFERVEREGKSESDYKPKRRLIKEILALAKSITKLELETLTTDVEDVKSARTPNKTLRLLRQGCTAMGFVLNALYYYIDSEDLSFLSLARDGDSLIKSIEKML